MKDQFGTFLLFEANSGLLAFECLTSLFGVLCWGNNSVHELWNQTSLDENLASITHYFEALGKWLNLSELLVSHP